MPKSSPRSRRGPTPPDFLHYDQFGMTAGEAAHLRDAVVRVIDRSSDRHLTFIGEPLFQFLEEQGPLFGLVLDNVEEPGKPTGFPQVLRRMARELKQSGTRPRPTRLDRRLDWLSGVLGLDPVERVVLGLFARITTLDAWNGLAQAVQSRSRNLTSSNVAMLTGLSPLAVEERLAPGAPLLRSSFIADDGDGEYSASNFLKRIAQAHACDPEVLAQRMMPAASPSTLVWEDFAHLGPSRDLAAAVLSSGAGVSILLHGEPGTGKTEFARALADRLGRGAVFAGLADEDGGEPRRGDRLAHLSLLRALTNGDAGRIIVVDEADDVLRLAADRHGERVGSKLWLNRLVEAPGTPTVWIANDPACLGDTIVRRMTLAIGFGLPPVSVRTRVVRRAAARSGVALDDIAVASVAALPVAPAVLANAVSAAFLSGGAGDEAWHAGEGVLRALGGKPPRRRLPAAYDPTLSRADHDLAGLSQRLCVQIRRGPTQSTSNVTGANLSVLYGTRLLVADGGGRLLE